MKFGTLIRNLVAGVIGLTCSAAAAQTLPPLNGDGGQVYVAGISSGGYMAVQMHIAYSQTIRGAAVYAGGPDGCAQDSVKLALTSCLSGLPALNASALADQVRTWASQGLIDPVSNLKGQSVYLWSSPTDAVVRQPVMDVLRDTYRSFGADVFRYDNDYAAAHGWESPDGVLGCATFASPYVVRCARAGQGSATSANPYDSEAVWLRRWFGPLHPKTLGALKGRLLPFGQDAFAPGGDAGRLGMDRTGFAFVPQDCAAGRRCAVLLMLHGCNQSSSSVGMAFIQQAGVNAWADTNHLIVIYPQTKASSASGGNPQGCWDWWGYLGRSDYDVRSGSQMQALKAMLAKVTGRG